jgi:diguanylate cyclase (GGDEF)-like protein/PAS domain S-box-containing protein
MPSAVSQVADDEGVEEPMAPAGAAPSPPHEVRTGPRGVLCGGYLVCAALLTVVYFAVPARHLLVWAPIGVSAVAATLFGIRLHRPAERGAWYLFAVALALFTVGDATYDVLTVTFHQDNPFPSLADVYYLGMYPIIALGLQRLIRARTVSRDNGGLIDALIIGTGLGLLSWVYLILPYVHAEDLTVFQRAIAIAYPLGDVLVLALLARLVAGGLRIRSLQLLAVGIAGLLVADVLYGAIQLTGDWKVGGPVDLGWVVFYTLWGAAALHPSMREVGEPLPLASGAVRVRRLVLLALVSLSAPGVLLIQTMTGRATHSSTIAVFSAVLYLLVVIRLAGIVRTHQASVERERALRSSGELLVAAQTADDVYQVAITAAGRLAAAQDIHESAIYVGGGDGEPTRVVAGRPIEPVEPVDLWAVARQGGRLIASGGLSISPLSYDGQLRGLLAVRTATAMSMDVHGALSTLAWQVALALESVALAEEVRRQQNDAHFKSLVQNASDVILVVSHEGIIDFGTPSLQRCLGRCQDDVLGSHISTLLDSGTAPLALRELAGVVTAERQLQAVTEWSLLHGDGSSRPFEVMVSNLLEDANVGGVVLTMRDVSERRALEEQLRHQAFHDGLTGLANRVLFHDRVQQALARLGRHSGTLAVVMLDLDDFKLVNDRLGHAAGDELLTTTADRLAACVRGGDTVARLGGDEFAVLMEDVPGKAAARELAERLVRAVGKPLMMQSEEIFTSVSAGLVVMSSDVMCSDQEGAGSVDIMRRADLALYAAKERGKAQVADYVDELHVKMMEREAQKRELDEAIAEQQFVLHYQPIVEIATGTIVGAEALVRWNHPERGLLGPGEFIAPAEESGMIVELGHWVLSEALREAATWPSVAGRRPRISVNVSARQLQEPDFTARAVELIARHGTGPQELVLEITESVLVSKGSIALESLEELRDLGVRIAVDDFGVGYSSLAYLQELPIDILKIDKSFVDQLGIGGRRGAALAKTVVSLAKSLHLDVVAEGIERIEQRDELWTMGCPLGQGYLIARPMKREEFAHALTRERLGPAAPGMVARTDSTWVGPPVPAPSSER